MQPGVNGFITPSGDASAIADALEKLASDPHITGPNGGGVPGVRFPANFLQTIWWSVRWHSIRKLWRESSWAETVRFPDWRPQAKHVYLATEFHW